MRVLQALVLICAAAPTVATADYFRVFVPPNVPRVQRLTPGAEGSIEFRVTRLAGETGLGNIVAHDISTDGSAGYEFVGSPAANCAAPVAITDHYGLPALGFPVQLPSGAESITCSYRIRRGALARDLRLDVCIDDTDPLCYGWFVATRTFSFGDLPDSAVRVEPAEPVERGATSALVRVVATNPSAIGMRHRHFETECAEFGGGIFFPAPYEIENDFPGACPTDPVRLGCVSVTGQNFDSRAYRVENLPARGEGSCLLRLRLVRPLQAPVALKILAHDQLPYVDRGTAFDVNRANDEAPLGVAPPATPVPAASATWLAVLVAGLLAVAALARARRKS